MKIVTFYENIIIRILDGTIVVGQGNRPHLLSDGLVRYKETGGV